jgi:hypothetical protein
MSRSRPTAYPPLDESQADLFASLNGEAPVYANRDLSGYFCRHTAAWQGRAADFRALFRHRPVVQDWLRPAMAAISGAGAHAGGGAYPARRFRAGPVLDRAGGMVCALAQNHLARTGGAGAVCRQR